MEDDGGRARGGATSLSEWDDQLSGSDIVGYAEATVANTCSEYERFAISLFRLWPVPVHKTALGHHSLLISHLPLRALLTGPNPAVQAPTRPEYAIKGDCVCHCPGLVHARGEDRASIRCITKGRCRTEQVGGEDADRYSRQAEGTRYSALCG